MLSRSFCFVTADLLSLRVPRSRHIETQSDAFTIGVALPNYYVTEDRNASRHCQMV